MTLEEMIKKAENKAEIQEKLAKKYDNASGYTSTNSKQRSQNAIKHTEEAAEWRQIAEWLTELKTYKANSSVSQNIKQKITTIIKH